MQTVKREAGEALDLGCFDVVVCGGGLSGWAAAVTLARQERRVLLAAERTAQGWEVWGALSVWVDESQPGPLLGEVLDGLRSSDAVARGVLDPVATEVMLDRLSTDAGVKLLVQVCCHPGESGQVLITGKWGLMAAQGALVVDATPAGGFAREAGGRVEVRATDEVPLRRALVVRAELAEEAEFAVPAELPVAGGKVLARPGRWPGDVILQAALTLDRSDPSRFEIDSRHALIDIGAHLRAEERAFSASSFVQVAHDGLLPRSEVCVGTAQQPLLPEGVPGVVLASAFADLGEITAEDWHTAHHAISVGESAAAVAAGMMED